MRASISFALLIALLAGGCASTRIKHLPPKEFLAQAQQIEAMNSATWTTYIGASATRAYLEYGDVIGFVSKSRTIVYWTELEGLPAELRQKLKAGDRPWIPWQEKVDKPRDNKPTQTDESACVRGEPEPFFAGNNPQIKSHTFVLRSATEATEKVVLLSGDRIIILNGGCEYYVNSFRYESAKILPKDPSATYWGAEAAKALRKLQALRPSVVFDLTKGAEVLEKLVKKPGKLSLDAEIPVEGDGTEFLQTRVVLKGGGLLQGQAGGYVAFDLVKGPL